MIKDNLLRQIVTLHERVAYWQDVQARNPGTPTAASARDKEMELRACLDTIQTERLPSGGGFDAGTVIERASRDCVVFSVGFHHMNENGYYYGWTEHMLYVVPDIVDGFRIRSISGPDRAGIKDYIADTMQGILSGDAYKFGE